MKKILLKLVNNEISLEEAEKMLKTSQIDELEDFARLDTARHLRTGIPEVIFAENKEDEDLLKIIMHCANIGHVMVTRLTEDRYELIMPKIVNSSRIFARRKQKIADRKRPTDSSLNK